MPHRHRIAAAVSAYVVRSVNETQAAIERGRDGATA
jgi:hypothetical protein